MAFSNNSASSNSSLRTVNPSLNEVQYPAPVAGQAPLSSLVFNIINFILFILISLSVLTFLATSVISLIMFITKSKQTKLVFTIAAWSLGAVVVCVVLYTILAIIRNLLTL